MMAKYAKKEPSNNWWAYGLATLAGIWVALYLASWVVMIG